MNFSQWLIKEEAVRTYKKANPKNPAQNFVVLYGNTFPIKDQLKKMGFRYFQGTWSTLEDKLTDVMKKELEGMGVDLSGLSAEMPAETPSSPPQIQQGEQSKADDILDKMQADLNKAIASADGKVKGLITDIEEMIERVANSTDEAAKQNFIKNFLMFSSRFHQYSLHNQLLIWIQTKGQAKHVASATNWPKLGRTVKNWGSGITILRPNFKNVTKEKVDNVTGEKKEEKFQLKFFKAAKVYDVSATEPIPGHNNPFNPVSRKDWSKDSNEDVEELNILINALTNWIKKQNINVDYEALSAEMGGYSAGGKIALNDTFKGMNLFSTLVHETAHELLHWMEKDKSSSRQEKEIDAETTAFIVANHFGFETKDTSNYLALWRAKGDDIRARRQNIQKASKEIIEGIKKEISQVEIDFESEDEEN